MSKRSIVSYKLESRIQTEISRQEKLQQKLAQQNDLVAGLKRSLAAQQTRPPSAHPSAAGSRRMVRRQGVTRRYGTKGFHKA